MITHVGNRMTMAALVQKAESFQDITKDVEDYGSDFWEVLFIYLRSFYTPAKRFETLTIVLRCLNIVPLDYSLLSSTL